MQAGSCRRPHPTAIATVGLVQVIGIFPTSALLSKAALGQEPTFASDWYSAAFNGIDDVEEVASYLRAFKLVQGLLRNRSGLPINVRLLGDAHRLLMDGARGSGKQPGELPLAKLYRW